MFEPATGWTNPPRVTADITGLLAQTIVPPWVTQLRRLEHGTIGEGPEDDRPIETVAAIAGAAQEKDEGDSSTPRTPTKPCDASSKRLRPRAPSDGTMAG